VGGTRYIDEWLKGVLLLKPSVVVIAKDMDRSEPLPVSDKYQIIEYKSNKAWKGYELRHLNYESDYGIGLGITKLMELFISRSERYFLHIDSDVIIDDKAVRTIYPLTWDYLCIVIPVIPRDKRDDPNEKPHWFWDSTNFGLSRNLVMKIYDGMKEVLKDPYPIDIKIHNLIRSARPFRTREVRRGVSHYISGKKVPLA